ncbi:MAG: phosphodiesterase [Alphaproteobacteria bacterium]
MKFLQFTDIHLTTPGQSIGGRDPNANFEKALNHALGLHGDAEAIFITGDLSDWGEKFDYSRLKDRIAEMQIPVHLAIGNHDDRQTFLSVFPELADRDGHIQKVVSLSEGTGIVIDTWGPKSHAGYFCEKRAKWLDEQLEQVKSPVYLFMHHNPVPTHIGPTDQIMLKDSTRLGSVISKYRDKVSHIFFGHCHMPLAGSFHGIPLSAPRGTNHAGFANFAETKMLTASDLPEAYSVVITDGPCVTVHMIEFGYRGDLKIEGSPDYADWNRDKMRR